MNAANAIAPTRKTTAGRRPGTATADLTQVNAFLRDYKTRGGFDQLGDRWLKEQKEAFRKLGYGFYF